jgi:hypothetical protein
MRKLLLSAVTVGVVASSALIALPGTAVAAGASRTCAANSCSIDAPGFTGGQLAVDADVHGVGTAKWTVLRGITTVCSVSFPASDPPRSWVCNNLPAGRYVAFVVGPAGPTNIGLRW